MKRIRSRKKGAVLGSLVLAAWLVSSCGTMGPTEAPDLIAGQSPGKTPDEVGFDSILDVQPSIVYYQIFVRSFYDSNGDGIGDLKGIEEKLDYLSDLGVQGIWLTPIQPSPSYHGYDITDYYSINPQFGTMDDCQHLIQEAHKRRIKVIMDLVVNHTSSKHPWFLDSAADKISPHRNWYTWQEGLDAYNSGEQSATGGSAWHKKGSDSYLGVFSEGMPDLNFDNPDVRHELVQVGQFWLKLGFDGFRLDAAKHVYDDLKSSSGSQEIAAKNQAWWQEFRKGLNEVNPDAYLVGEVWDSASVAAPYVNHAFNSTFDFDLNKTLRTIVSSEQTEDLAELVKRSYQPFYQESGGSFVDATFLGNHDMDRVMSSFNGNLEHAKMAAALLLTLPGNPFVYYGDEIGMQGRGADENKREPMLWSESEKGQGQTTWEPILSNRGRSRPSVEVQRKDPDSLWNFYKNLIDLRKKEPALRDGDIGSYEVNTPGVVSYLRMTDHETVLVLHNISGKKLTVTLNHRSTDAFNQLSFSTNTEAALADNNVTLPPYSTVVLKP
ncbi:alpha-amylase family glycosyl hydrolase [Paenibacillus hexagrammi]|uniref:Alpha-amylase n=1 Tax=Paenibacillus hexagrammi TaxID=2908839 RepID=A0ABY3SLS3_9BACL|nr:alpha-amylase family glycosyl hydrolase [Paenibacillus sp. YPD9-1]UJF34490.1 DUF3459 domain-containing protein [Paenibacillus sp. YPD9-1]